MSKTEKTTEEEIVQAPTPAKEEKKPEGVPTFYPRTGETIFQ